MDRESTTVAVPTPSVRVATKLSEVTTRRSSCEYCRLRKVKCDGVKPMCGFCVKRNMRECTYLGLPRKRRKDAGPVPENPTSVSSDIAQIKSDPFTLTLQSQPADDAVMAEQQDTSISPAIEPFKSSSPLLTFDNHNSAVNLLKSSPAILQFQPTAIPTPPFDAFSWIDSFESMGANSPTPSEHMDMVEPSDEDPLLACLYPGHGHADVERILQGLLDNRALILLFCFHYNVLANEFYELELDLQLALLTFGALIIDDPSHPWYFEQARAAMIMQVETPTIGCLQSIIILSGCSHLRRDMSAAWVLLSMACRLALLFELNKDPDELQNKEGYGDMSNYHKEKRRRCWWNCYLIELLIATYICRPRILSDHTVKYPISEREWEKLSAYYSAESKPRRQFIAEIIDCGENPVTYIVKAAEIILANSKLKILRQFARNPDDPAMDSIKPVEQAYPGLGKVTSLEQAHRRFAEVDQMILKFLSELPPHLLLPLPPINTSTKGRHTPDSKSISVEWDHDDPNHPTSQWLEEFFRIDPKQPPWTILSLNYMYYGVIVGLHTEWIYFILQTLPDEDDEEEEEDRAMYLAQLNKSLELLRHASASLASLSIRLQRHLRRSKFWGDDDERNIRKGRPARPKFPIPSSVNVSALVGIFGSAICYAAAASKWTAIQLDQAMAQTENISLLNNNPLPSDPVLLNGERAVKESMQLWRDCVNCLVDLFRLIDIRSLPILQSILDMCSKPAEYGLEPLSSSHSSPSDTTTNNSGQLSGSPPPQSTTSSMTGLEMAGISPEVLKGIQRLSDLERAELPTIQAMILSARREVGMVLAARDKLSALRVL